MDNQLIWLPPTDPKFPVEVNSASDILPFAKALTTKQKDNIKVAFENGAYDMVGEFVWKKTMIRLKNILEQLGMDFIGEMLGREDINRFSVADKVLTDYNAILLAEELNIINSTSAMNLRHASEMMSHYFSDKAEGELNSIKCLNLVQDCIKAVLTESEISIATDFQNFRQKLLKEIILENDPALNNLVNSSIFFIRTSLVVLLNAIKSDKPSAERDKALQNINLLVPLVWEKMREEERFMLGNAYRDVSSAGDNQSSAGLKNLLTKVSGFDYVPENLRSNTFIFQALQLQDAHFEFNNFYKEPILTKNLASLGTIIPAPALAACLRAYILVAIGNRYGISNGAYHIAIDELEKISEERWRYFFDKVFFKDKILLSEISSGDRRTQGFLELFQKEYIPIFDDFQRPFSKLFTSIRENRPANIADFCKDVIRFNKL